jgi:hypothetical protein
LRLRIFFKYKRKNGKQKYGAFSHAFFTMKITRKISEKYANETRISNKRRFRLNINNIKIKNNV